MVMGLPGAGKSTVLEIASQMGWEIINYGSAMFEIAQKKFKISHRDEIRKLPISAQKEIQKEVGIFLAQKSKNKREIILDTHCSINTPDGYLPGLPFEILKDLNIEKLVLITAPPQDILKRRVEDKSRIRDSQSLELIVEHEQLNRAFLAAYSFFCSAPASIIINADGKLEQSKQRLKQLLE
ncbi:MAG: adenylate kinase [Candidatus Anstonellaceae archaeon]